MISYNKNKYNNRGRGSGPRDLQNRRNNAGSSLDESVLISSLQAQIVLLTEQLSRSSSSAVSGITPEELDLEIRKAVASTKRELEHNFEIERAKYKEQLQITETGAGSYHSSPTDAEVNAVIESAVSEAKSYVEAEAQKQIKATNKKLADTEKKCKLQTLELENLNKQLQSRLTDKEKDIIRLESGLKTLNDKIAHQTEMIKLKDDIIVSLRSELAEYKEGAMGKEGSSSPDATSSRPQMETVYIDPTDKNSKPVKTHIKVEPTSSITKKEEMANSVNKLKDLMGSLPIK